MMGLGVHKFTDTGNTAQSSGFPLTEEFSVGHLDCIAGSVHFYLSSLGALGCIIT
jgi:hypothetical protein